MSPSVWDDLEIDAYDILSRSVVPSTQKMKERFQATITHLRENISNAIESDVRDFGAKFSPALSRPSTITRGRIEVAWRKH